MSDCFCLKLFVRVCHKEEKYPTRKKRASRSRSSTGRQFLHNFTSIIGPAGELGWLRNATIGISWKARGTAQLGRPRNLSLFDDVTGLMSLDGRSSIISGQTSSSLSFSFSLSLAPSAPDMFPSESSGTINVYLNYRSTAIWDRAYPMQFRRRPLLLLCVFHNESGSRKLHRDDNDDEDVHRRRHCDSINSPLSDNLGQLIPSCSTCVIVQSYDSDSRCCRRDCCVTSLRRDVVSQRWPMSEALPSFESLVSLRIG